MSSINLADFEEFEEKTAGCPVVLHVRIRKDSKYFGQSPESEIFPVDVVASKGGYVFRGKHGDYRVKDVDVFAAVSAGVLVPVSEVKSA